MKQEKCSKYQERDFVTPRMTKDQVIDVAIELMETAKMLDWHLEEMMRVSTGSIYMELTRSQGKQKEWVAIRVANHKQVYFHWMTTYSWSPCEYDDKMIFEVLMKPFGKTGDVFEVE